MASVHFKRRRGGDDWRPEAPAVKKAPRLVPKCCPPKAEEGASGYFELLPDSIVLDILALLRDAEDTTRVASTCTRLRKLVDAAAHLHFIGTKARYLRREAFELVISSRIVRSTDLRCLRVESDEGVSDLAFYFWVEHSKDSLQKLHFTEPSLPGNLSWRLRTLSKCPKLAALAFAVMFQESSYTVLNTGFASGCSPFRNLLQLTIERLATSDPVLEELLALCPQLRELELNGILGLSNPTISAPRLERLVIEKGQKSSQWGPGEDRDLALILKTPKLQTLTLSLIKKVTFAGRPEDFYYLDLVDCNNVEFAGDVVSLSNLEDLSIRGDKELTGWSWERLGKLLKRCPTLYYLVLDMDVQTWEERIIPGPFLMPLRHLNRLTIQGSIVERMVSSWGLLSESQNGQPVLPTLKALVIRTEKMGQPLIAFIRGLLRPGSCLEEVKIEATWPETLEVDQTIGYSYFRSLFQLQRDHPGVKFDFQMPWFCEESPSPVRSGADIDAEGSDYSIPEDSDDD